MKIHNKMTSKAIKFKIIHKNKIKQLKIAKIAKK